MNKTKTNRTPQNMLFVSKYS